MKNAITTFVICLMLFLIGGCNSIVAQHHRFIEYQNAQIGLPFYAYELQGRHEIKINETESEFVPDSIPPGGAGLVWKVDTSTRGPYLHPNGLTFQIEGIKKSWRIIGDPQKCLIKINWWSGNW
jgi:hypothetical protein